MMTKSICLLILLVTSHLSLPAQIKIGDKVHLEKMGLVAVNKSKIDKSKITVVDFWGTWCGPCIAAFPHLDSLQKKYKDKIQVITITAEPAAKVSNFIKTRKNTPSFAFFTDQPEKVITLFGIEGYPTTAIILPDGTFKWISEGGANSSLELEAILEKGIEKGNYPMSDKKYYANVAAPAKKEKFLYRYQLSMSDSTDKEEATHQNGPFADSSFLFECKATPVLKIVRSFLGISENAKDLQCINKRPELDTIRVNMIAINRSGRSIFEDEVQKIITDLEQSFRFSIKKEEKMADTYFLTVTDPKKLQEYYEPTKGGGASKSGGGRIRMTRISLGFIASICQDRLKLFLSYEGKDMSMYTFEMSDFNNIEELEKELKKFGLGLVLGKSSQTIYEFY